MKLFGYGITKERQAHEFANAVCHVLGGGENAVNLLIETAMQETKMGSYSDRHAHKWGVGITQFDQIGIDEVKRSSPHVKNQVLNAFGVDIDAIELRDLAYSPLLSFICCRCFYLLKPGAIPGTVEERGEYWKMYFNSEAGHGTAEQYVSNAMLLNPFA